MRSAAVFLLILFVVCLPAAAFASGRKATQPVKQTSWFSAGGEVDFNALYIWHGMKLSDGPVMQPSAWITAYGATFTVWSNFTFDDKTNNHEFNEVDLYFTYSHDFGNLTVTPEVQLWFFPNQRDAPTSGEASLALGYRIAGPLSVFIKNYVEIIEDNGGYSGELGLAIDHEFSEKASFAASASVLWGASQYNGFYFGVDKNALNVAMFAFSLTLEPIKHLTLGPHVEISSIIDDDLRATVSDSTLVNVGASIGAEW